MGSYTDNKFKKRVIWSADELKLPTGPDGGVVDFSDKINEGAFKVYQRMNEALEAQAQELVAMGFKPEQLEIQSVAGETRQRIAPHGTDIASPVPPWIYITYVDNTLAGL